ncbi:hypothetical protein MATL_G00152360 [Megalops atlanticus]|uniref:Uncharacterized protein n=1 Tax=Megalops atlanticus TaxID=7932 RepID=A0A9D3PSE7_MEGAT|nr:hypothetical protein MATL_G00152360 [Megalops atlanticus]
MPSANSTICPHTPADMGVASKRADMSHDIKRGSATSPNSRGHFAQLLRQLRLRCCKLQIIQGQDRAVRHLLPHLSKPASQHPSLHSFRTSALPGEDDPLRSSKVSILRDFRVSTFFGRFLQRLWMQWSLGCQSTVTLLKVGSNA